MTGINSTNEAKQAIQDDAAAKAIAYLEREAPRTMAAITYLIREDKWTVEAVMSYFYQTYDMTEEKTRHKIRLATEAMARERDQ